MNNKVKFLRGTSNEYTTVEKDSDTIYFTTDDGKLYIGDKEVSSSGSYELPIATTEILGGVMPDGTTITVDENGVISGSKTSAGSTVNPVYFSEGKPVACTYTLGKSVPSNAVFTDTVYTLPKATTSVLGGVKVDGTTIAVDSNGVISTTGGLTVDTLLDITVNGNTPSPANNSIITLAGNMTDYKFVYFLSTFIGIVKYEPEPRIINSSILEWSTYTSGTYLYRIYGIAEIYYISSSKIKITYNTNVNNKNTERLVILGIK